MRTSSTYYMLNTVLCTFKDIISQSSKVLFRGDRTEGSNGNAWPWGSFEGNMASWLKAQAVVSDPH